MKTAKTFFGVILLTTVLSHSIVTQSEKDDERFRQAERLLPILLEADSVDDPALRALIRFECLEFIYGQKHPSLQVRTDSKVLEFYAELVPGKRPIRSDRINRWQNELLILLRRNRPDLAKQVEATYLKNEDVSSAELQEIWHSGNVRDVVERTIDRLSRDVYVFSLSSIEEAVRTKDPDEADRLVNSAFDESERPGSVRLPILTLVWHRPPEFFEKWSPHLRTRYLKLIITAVRSNTDKPGSDSVLRTAKGALNRNYDNFRRYAPEMVADADALIMPSPRAMSNFDSDESRRRIETSIDKVKQALWEADSVSDNWTKYQLLSQAMTHAAETKQFARAVEIAESARKYVSSPATTVDYDLWMRVLPRALDNKDSGAATLIISKISSDVSKAGALADLALVHARASRKDEALRLIKQAYLILEKNTSALVPASVIFQLVDPAFIAESGEGFEAARRSIALVNRLPEQKPEERIGGPQYESYAERVLIPIGTSMGSTFSWMASKDITVAEALEQDLSYRPWKLLARIAIEQNRRPLVRSK
jgi:hypothetical protein